MKRERHRDRVEGINERLRGGGRIERDPTDDFVPVELRRGEIVAGNGPLDHFGDCAGFGAPQARAAREQMGWRE